MKRAQNYNTLQQRRETFLRRGRYRWPYIKYSSYLAQPDTLASAGFVFNPVKDAPDNVQCFHCGFELTGWEATDDPFAEHYKHKPSCTFAQIHCQTRVARLGNSIEWTGWPYESNPGLMPEERKEAHRDVLAMRNDVELRLATFTAGEWPHAGREGWNVTPERLAEAGFYFTPEWVGDDTATCAFCGYALAEWEPDDDP
ncbi:BIR-domain-containing protein, partial [Coemansia reversa NRRL 1564]